MLTRNRTRPVPKIAIPDPIRPAGTPVTRTRSLPVGLLLLGIIGLMALAYPLARTFTLH